MFVKSKQEINILVKQQFHQMITMKKKQLNKKKCFLVIYVDDFNHIIINLQVLNL